MALADRVARRAQRAREVTRSDPVTMEDFGYMLGRDNGTAARTRPGVTMGQNRALGISAWYSGVRYIAETVAGISCYTYRQTPTGRQLRIDPPWKRRPDTEMIWFSFVEFCIFCLLHRGNFYAYKLRNDASQVTGLRAIHPDRVKLVQATDGMKLFVVDNNRARPFSSREILHIPALSVDGIVGLNPIAAQAETLGLVAAADEYAGRAWDGDHVRAYLTADAVITGTQADEIQAEWERQHRGLMNANRVAVFGGGLEYKTIGLDPQQTQLLESRKFGVAEVSRILRLPPHKLYDLERSTNNNIEHQSIEAVTDGIRPWTNRLEAHINSDPDLTTVKTFLEFDLEDLYKGDLLSQMEAWEAGVQGGLIMPSEPRTRMSLPFVAGSDVLFRPLNMTTYGPGASVHPDPEPTEVPAA